MADAEPSLVLRQGNVFDSESRQFRAGLDVVCAGGRIAAVTPDAAAPPGAREVDCAGRYVLPGLIDCHVHLAFGGAADMAGEVSAPVPVQAWRAAEHARRTLQAGVTTVRDLGAPRHLNVHLARATAERLVEGPTILAAGMGVTMTGGHGYTSIAREADGADEVRKAVREQLRAGATAIKLFASGGVMTPGVNPKSPSFTEDELRAGVEEGHKAFRVVGAHAQSTEGIKNAIRAGVNSVEHGIWLDDEAIELMCERGTYLVPTLSAPYNINRGGLEAGIPAYAVEKNARVLQDHFESFRAAVKAGVRVAMGTDQGTPLNRPGENGQEVVRMAEGGLPAAAAIMAATAWAAELLGVADDRGRLAEGLAADMVVLRSDPGETIDAIANGKEIAYVLKDGRIVKKESEA